MLINLRKLPPMTKADKDQANSMNLEWLKLSNKVLRAYPGSPRRKELQAQLDKIPMYKENKAL